jgi:5'-3' exonuclease
MGIPGFNSWFYENNKAAYQPLAQTQVDHLYIDMNSVLHNVLRKGEVQTLNPQQPCMEGAVCFVLH